MSSRPNPRPDDGSPLNGSPQLGCLLAGGPAPQGGGLQLTSAVGWSTGNSVWGRNLGFTPSFVTCCLCDCGEGT